jgi:hypothetical protein
VDAFRSSRQKKISRKQESSVAKDLGGRTQAASGATRLGGGADVRAPGYRVECKYTEGYKYSLKRSELHKLKSQAARTLEQPVMQLAFVDQLGRRTEFAITKTVDLNSSHLTRAKSFVIDQEQLEGLLRAGVTYAVRFNGDNEAWRIRHWYNFLEEVTISRTNK